MNSVSKFFKMPYDIPHDPRIQLIRDECGGIIALAYWVTLLANLYYWDGLIDLTKPGQRTRLKRELELDDEGLDRFLEACAAVNFIDAELLKMGHVVSHGVCDELAYKKTKSDAGKQGGRPRKKQREKHDEKHA